MNRLLVVVFSEQVPAPVHVRFGWHKLANPNLVNSAGLPASPFQTDNWTGGTGETVQTPVAKADSKQLTPTEANVSYGPHASNVLDFWKAPGNGPRPLLVYIHGGGWIGGDKKRNRQQVQPYLDKGISYAAINYRLTGEAPLPAPVHDAARAIQYIRSKSGPWNIDKSRIALTGGSAGACTSMWLLLHDDLADLTVTAFGRFCSPWFQHARNPERIHRTSHLPQPGERFCRATGEGQGT